MCLLNLPLETFREIIKQVYSCGDVHDLGKLKLINKLFLRETIDWVCTKIEFDSENERCKPFAAYYIQRRSFAPDVLEGNIFIRTVRDVSYRIIDHLDPGRQEKLKQTSLAVFQAAAEINFHGCLGPVLKEKGSWKPTNPYGYHQASDGREHILPVAVNMGNLPLVERLLEPQKRIGIDTGSNVFNKPLFNAVQRGHSEIARVLIDEGAKTDHSALERDEHDVFE